MDINQRIDFLEKSLDRIVVMISATDLKLPYIVAIDTAMIGVIAAMSAGRDGLFPAEILALLLGTLPPLLSLVFVALVAIPRTEAPRDSIIFFMHIQRIPLDEYAAQVREVKAEDYIADLAYQCHSNAAVAATKYRYLKWSLWCLFVSVPLWAIALFVISST